VLAAIEECAPADASPIDVFESLEQMLRAHFAKQSGAIDSKRVSKCI